MLFKLLASNPLSNLHLLPCRARLILALQALRSSKYYLEVDRNIIISLHTAKPRDSYNVFSHADVSVIRDALMTYLFEFPIVEYG